jgi:phosphate transport system substrate-binding protein
VKRRALEYAAGASALLLAGALTACTPPNERAGAAGGDSDLAGTLSIGGSSAQEAAQNAWRAGFQGLHPGVTVNYDPIGSGGGREQFISGGFPAAGSDTYLTDDEGELSSARERCDGRPPIELPNYISPIAVVHSVEGVEDLRLSPDAVAGIFAGDITTWDDPAVAETNPDADLPSATINPVHRSDESGTTGNFTNYLATAAPDAWRFGEVESWPVRGGEGGQGTAGVVSAVRQGTNSIGYADASQAGDLGVALIGVGEDFVAPEPEAAARIFEVSPRADNATESQLIFDLDYRTEEAGTYPIVLTSYLMACPSYDDARQAELVKAYMAYLVSDEGQAESAENAGSAPLPASVADEARAIIDGIEAG